MDDILNPDLTPQDDNGLEVVDFSDPTLFLHHGVSDARWQRAHANPDVRDLIQDLFGLRGNPISCPFHGSDSRPSFNLFPKNNDCTCYGCGDGDNYWDNVKIVARNFGYRITDGDKVRDDRVTALKWLETHYPMPELTGGESMTAPDMVIVEEEGSSIPEDPLEGLELKVLREHFVRLSSSRVQAAKGCPEDALAIAPEHLELLFVAVKQENKLTLARVLGRNRILALIRAK